MRLVRKLTLALTLGMSTVFVCYAFLSVLRQAAYFRQEATRDQQTIGRALSLSVATMWSAYGDQAAVNLVALMNQREPDMMIRWIDLDRVPGAESTPAPQPKVEALEPAPTPSVAPPPDAFAPSNVISPSHLPGKAAGASASQEKDGGSGADPTVLSPQLRATLLAGDHHTSVKPGQGATVGTIKTYVPVRTNDRVIGAIMLEDTLTEERAYLYSRVRRMTIAGTLMIVVASLLAMALGVQFVAHPIRALVAKARRIGAGDFAGPLPTAQRDELGELAAEMNAMADQLSEAHRRLHEETRVRIAALEQLRHAERLSTVGQLASGVAHELGTPLNVISGRAQMIVAGEVSATEAPACARIIDAQARRMAAIIGQLLNLARRPAPQRMTTDIHELVGETLTLLAPLADKRGIELVHDGAAPNGDGPAHEVSRNGSGSAPVDAEQIRQVVTNLVINAIQASADGARIEVAVGRVAGRRRGQGAAGEFMRITVADQGHGIAADVLPHIFEPFFTTKDVGDGTGLGLSVAYGIVEDHAGWIDVRSEPGTGTQFDVYFPTQAVS